MISMQEEYRITSIIMKVLTGQSHETCHISAQNLNIELEMIFA